MTSTQKIIVPEQAYRELLCGGDPVEIASRCEIGFGKIGFPFERRDWMATVAGVQVMLEYVKPSSAQYNALIELSRLLIEMIQRDINAAKKRIDEMKVEL